MNSDHSSPASSSARTRPTSGVSAQRACDECRTRKIRCDRKIPCSHCRAAGLACRITRERQRATGSRVMISRTYENKIDGIESRLAGIESLLRDHLSALKATSSGASVDPSPYKPAAQISSHDVVLEEAPGDRAPFSGLTGPSADSIQAKEIVEQTIGGNAVVLQDEKFKGALQSLEQIVGRMKADATEPSLKSLDVPNQSVPAEPILPRWEEILPLLQRAQVQLATVFMLSIPTVGISEFSQKCRVFFDHPQAAPPTRRLLVYCGLYWLAAEFSALELELACPVDLARTFKHLVLRTLAALPLVLPATMVSGSDTLLEPKDYASAARNAYTDMMQESIEALVAGSCFAIDLCKPSLSQNLTSAAARLCQTLGYHRYASMTDDSAEDRNRKIMIFWNVYMTDKMISLRLGHASAIQDFEVALPRPEPSESLPASFVHLLSYWIELGRIQGQIGEKLYSPAALTLSNDIRANRARQLAQQLQEVHEARKKANDAILALFSFGGGSAEGMAQRLISDGDTVMHYGTLTLILHAIPASQPGISPAIDAARAALRAGPEPGPEDQSNNYFWLLYCHWITLNTPLTPFTVLFCHIIANHQNCQEDLQLLQRYIDSLHHLRNFSEGAEKLYQLCSVFSKVAEAFVAVKTMESQQSYPVHNGGLQPMVEDFDEYLSALGLGPQPFQPGFNGMAASDFQPVGDMSAYLQDWYTGNAGLYGLLDQDLSDINFASYPI